MLLRWFALAVRYDQNGIRLTQATSSPVGGRVVAFVDYQGIRILLRIQPVHQLKVRVSATKSFVRPALCFQTETGSDLLVQYGHSQVVCHRLAAQSQNASARV